MRQSFFCVAILLSVTSHLFSQANDEQAIREAVDLFQSALINNNAEAAKSLLTDDFALNAYGQSMNKEKRLASISSGQYKYGVFKKEDVKVTIYENTASVAIKTAVKYRMDDKDVSVSFSALTFTKKEEHWRISGECLLGDACYK